MIAIVNIGGDLEGVCKYQLRINQKVITEFEHNRLDDLGTCLRKAAKAADAHKQGEVVKMYLESYRWVNEKNF